MLKTASNTISSSILSERRLLSRDQVHLWIYRHDQTDVPKDVLNCLTADEIARADHILSEKTKEQYLSSRRFLRCLLSTYLNKSPEKIDITYGVNSKPELVAQSGVPSLQFNISHTEEITLCGLTLKDSIGIDLEKRSREVVDPKGVAKRFFHPDEYQYLNGVEESQRKEEFLCFWTVKEAYVKATGEGLSRSFNSFRVFREQENCFNIEEPSSKDSSNWCLLNVFPEQELISAIAINRLNKPILTFKNWNWKNSSELF